MSLTLAITTRNRGHMTVRAFEKVIDDQRLDEILIVDDNSTDGSAQFLMDKFRENAKVRVVSQIERRGMQQNKHDAVALSTSDWVILFDSDNILSTQYIDALFQAHDLFEDDSVIYAPDAALPNFGYYYFSGSVIDRANVKECLNAHLCGALLNTSNYVVNKRFYCDTYEYNPEVKGADSVWHAYNHFKNGGSIYVVRDMSYEHTVWEGSEFAKDMEYNLKHAAEIENLIRAL